jgi:hypothetical protein
MQQAVVMAANPPLLLFHNLERKVLEQHVEQLNSLGVEFDISEVQEALDDSDLNFGEHRETPVSVTESAPPPPPSPGAPPEPPEQPTPPEQPAPPTHTPVRAAEHEFHHIPGGQLDAIRDAENAARRKNLILAAVAVAALLIIGLLVANLPKGGKIAAETAPVPADAKLEKKSARAKTKTNGNAVQNASGAASGTDSAAKFDGEPRVQATAQQKQQAGAYVDSAKANGADARKSVAFYKMAISFNRQNLAAWQGLLQAYRELRMDDAAHETQSQMREIFGDGALSVVNIVKSHGELIDAYVNADGAYIVEYKITKSSKVDILRDVFGMTRAVRAACKCDNISIHVSTRSGKSVTAHSSRHTSVHTLSEFMRQAEIVWLDD